MVSVTIYCCRHIFLAQLPFIYNIITALCSNISSSVDKYLEPMLSKGVTAGHTYKRRYNYTYKQLNFNLCI